MTLIKQDLKTDIKELLNEMKTELDQEVAIEKYADRLATAIDVYIKSATVRVTGTSVSGGAVTGTGTIT